MDSLLRKSRDASGDPDTRRVTRSATSSLASTVATGAERTSGSTARPTSSSSRVVPRPTFLGVSSAASKIAPSKDIGEKESVAVDPTPSRRVVPFTSTSHSSTQPTRPTHTTHTVFRETHTTRSRTPSSSEAKFVSTRYAADEKKYSTSAAVSATSSVTRDRERAQEKESKDATSSLRLRYARPTAVPGPAEEKPVAPRVRERERESAKATERRQVPAVRARESDEEDFVLVEALSVRSTHIERRAGRERETKTETETETETVAMAVRHTARTVAAVPCEPVLPASSSNTQEQEQEERTTQQAEIATATATPVASIEDALDDTHTHAAVLESVEELAQSLAALARLVFSFLGDFRAVAGAHYLTFCAFLPLSVRRYAVAARPAVEEIAAGVELCASVLLVLLEVLAELSLSMWRALRPRRLDLALLALAGLLLCLFGGFFPLSIAAAEAFGAVGLRETQRSVRDVLQDLQCAWDESGKSERETERESESESERDGVTNDPQDPSVSEKSSSSTSTFVLRRVLRACGAVSPQRVAAALRDVSAGALAVWATLQSKHLRLVALSQSLAKQVERAIDALSLALGERDGEGEAQRKGEERQREECESEKERDKEKKPVKDKDKDKTVRWTWRDWRPLLSPWIARLIAFSIAWRVSSALSLFHCAARGGALFSRYALRWLAHHKLLSPSLCSEREGERNMTRHALAAMAAGIGIYVQFSVLKRTLPMSLQALLWPLSLCEFALQCAMSRSASPVISGVTAAVM